MSWYSQSNQQQQTPNPRHARKPITNAVNAGGLIRLTVTGHNFSAAVKYDVTGVGGVPNANATGWTITIFDANTVDLVGSTFAGAYTSGGSIYIQ